MSMIKIKQIKNFCSLYILHKIKKKSTGKYKLVFTFVDLVQYIFYCHLNLNLYQRKI